MKTLLKTAALRDSVQLQPHQQDALDHAKDKPGVILNHGLGSGKTISSLGIAEQKGGNVLALTPASLQDNYNKELKKFVTDDRHDAYDTVSYSKFRRDPDQYLNNKKYNTIVADELHRLRNPTKTRKSVEYARTKVPNMVGLTASLLNNRPEEAVPLTNLVAGDKVMSQEEFKRRHLRTETKKPGLWGRLKGVPAGETEHINRPDEIAEKFGPYVHRFTGSEEYKQNLPERVDENVDVEMSKKQVELMKALGKNDPVLSYKLKKNLPPSKQEKKRLNTFLTGMRQIANSPADYDETIDDPVKSSPKMQRMVEDLQKEQEGDENFRGVVYSNYLGSGVKPVVGEAGGEAYEGKLTQKQRKEMLDRFEQGDNKVLGLSPAGGEGIDLKGVKTMQVMEPDFNPETTSQAIGRAIRYGSHKHLPDDEQQVKVRKYRSVYPDKWYHKFKKKDRSVDEYLDQLAQDKAKLNQDFYDALPAYQQKGTS